MDSRERDTVELVVQPGSRLWVATWTGAGAALSSFAFCLLAGAAIYGLRAPILSLLLAQRAPEPALVSLPPVIALGTLVLGAALAFALFQHRRTVRRLDSIRPLLASADPRAAAQAKGLALRPLRLLLERDPRGLGAEVTWPLWLLGLICLAPSCGLGVLLRTGVLAGAYDASSVALGMTALALFLPAGLTITLLSGALRSRVARAVRGACAEVLLAQLQGAATSGE